MTTKYNRTEAEKVALIERFGFDKPADLIPEDQAFKVSGSAEQEPSSTSNDTNASKEDHA